MKAKARNCASSYSLHILHELLQLFMDWEIFEAEDLLISLSICLVVFRDGGHHLVCSIIPDIKKVLEILLCGFSGDVRLTCE